MMPSLMHMPGFKFLFMWKPSRNANCDQLSSHDLRRIMLLQNELSNEQSPQFVIQDVQKQTIRFHELSLIWTTISGRIIRPKAVFIHAEKISVAAAPALYLGARSFSCAVSGFESLNNARKTSGTQGTCSGYQRIFLARGGRKYFAWLRRPKEGGTRSEADHNTDMTDTGNCAR